MASVTITLGDLFDQAISIEYRAAKLYRKFSKLFASTESVSAFFTGLQDDEIDHVNLLKATRDSLDESLLKGEADPELIRLVADAAGELDQRLNDPVETLDDAYDIAHQVEFSEVNAMFRFIAMTYIPESYKVEFIESEIMQHQNKLVNFSMNFGSKAWRQGIGVDRI